MSDQRRVAAKNLLRRRNVRCRVKMIFLGRTIDLNEYSRSKDEIVVMQQHSGGENRRVFQGFLHANDSFEFDSLRERDYPFALTFFINGFIHCRISTCCEYKHQCGIPLGGRRASFLIGEIKHGKPCLQCRFEEYLRVKSFESECVEAKKIYEEVFLRLTEDIDWRRRSFVHWQLGNVCYFGLRDLRLALDHYLISLEVLCEHLSSMNEQLKDFYRVIGEILRETGDEDLSLDYLRRCTEIVSHSSVSFAFFSSFSSSSRTLYDAKHAFHV